MESRSLLAADLLSAGLDTPTLAEFQDGVWPDATYAGTRDTKIRAEKPTNNSGGSTLLDMDGDPDVATLLHWDLSAIPAGSTVENVAIGVNVTGTTNHTYEIYALKRAFNEDQSTWQLAATGASWEVAGADGSTDRGSTVLGTVNVTALGAATINLNQAGRDVVQGWVDNPASNFGFVIQDFLSATDAASFNSREIATPEFRPKLSINYWAPGVPVPNGPPQVNAGADQAFFHPNSATLDGTVSDDGRPNPPATFTTAWSQVGGPAGGAQFANAAAVDTTATFSQPGTYVLRLTANDGGALAFDDVTILVRDPADPLSIAFQNGVWPDATYAGTRDTKIRAANPTGTSGNSTALDLDGDPDVATMLRWDVSAIPAGSTVHQVSISVNVTGTTVHTYEVYALNRDWHEKQATWLNTANGVTWEVPGADGAADRGTTVLGTFSVPTVGMATINLNAAGRAVVQSWVDNPASNFGFIIQDYLSATDSMGMTSRELATAELRPKLSVSYLIPGAPINFAPDVEAGANQSVSLPNAAVLDGTVSDDGLPAPPGATTAAWSMVSGPAPVLFADAAAEDTTASFQMPGTYVLRLTASDGKFSGSDDLTVVVGGKTPALSVIQAENFSARNNDSDHAWWIISSEKPGAGTLTGATGPYVQSLTDAGADSGRVNTAPAAPYVEYQVWVSPGGVYGVDLFGAGINTSSDSVLVQVPTGTLSNAEGNATGSAGSLAVALTVTQFTWRNAGQWNLAAGGHTIRVSMRESGAAIDAVRLERIVVPPPAALLAAGMEANDSEEDHNVAVGHSDAAESNVPAKRALVALVDMPTKSPQVTTAERLSSDQKLTSATYTDTVEAALSDADLLDELLSGL